MIKFSKAYYHNTQNCLKIIFSICLAFYIKIALCQDAEFTQFYSNPIYLNPAFAGTNNCPRLSTNHRSQWAGLPQIFNTTSFSYDQNFRSIDGGIGFMILSDRLNNAIQNNRISGMYSYEIKISKKLTLSTGIEASFWQNKFNQNQLTFVDMIDPIRGFVYTTANNTINSSKNGLDFSCGILAYSENFFLGFSTHHLTEPKQSIFSEEYKLERKYSLNIGYHFRFGYDRSISETNWIVSPNIIIKKQGLNEQLNIGVYGEKGSYVLGLWYRDNQNYAVLVGAKMGLIKIGYSYDINLSRLQSATSGSHEISIQINFKFDNKNSIMQSLSCPSF
jgi:type IX secretion system PorP/SprF family membrane protein